MTPDTLYLVTNPLTRDIEFIVTDLTIARELQEMVPYRRIEECRGKLGIFNPQLTKDVP